MGYLATPSMHVLTTAPSLPHRYLMGYLATPSPQAASNLDERAAGGAPAEKPIVRAKIGNEQYGLPPDMVRRNPTKPRHTNNLRWPPITSDGLLLPLMASYYL